MKKRLLSIFLVLCLVFSMLPGAALATTGTDEGELDSAQQSQPGPVALTSTSSAATAVVPRMTTLNLAAGTVSYIDKDGNSKTADPTSVNITDSGEGWSWYLNAAEGYLAKTLVLSGANIRGADSTSTLSYGIELPGVSKIELAAGTTNIVRGGNASASGSTSYGIHILGMLDISGSGTLQVTGGKANTSGGIYANTTVNITDATVTATGGTATAESCGICVANGTININGTAIVTATGGTASTGKSYGISAALASSSNSTININGGTVTATGGTASAESYGIYAYVPENVNYSAKVTITGGTVTATGGSSANSAGIFAKTNATNSTNCGKVDITGDTTIVNARGGTATLNSYGISAKVGEENASVNSSATIDITNSNVTATGGSGENSYGLYAREGATGGAVTISGAANVTATGGTATGTKATGGTSCGIFADSSATISGGTVTATGGTASGIMVDSTIKASSAGIYTNSNVEITGGLVTARGGTTSNTTNDSTGGGGNSSGIRAGSGSDSISISGGTVNATGGTAVGDSYGIVGSENITISGTATVTATGGTAYSSYGVFGSTINLNGGLVIARSGKATSGISVAMNKASTGTYTAALTGSESAKFAVYGESGKYTVIDRNNDLSGTAMTTSGSIGLDLTSGTHPTTITGTSGYSWADNTLTLKNVIINVDTAGLTGDTYGIKLPNADTIIALSGTNIIRGGDATGSSYSYGIYSKKTFTINDDGAVHSFGGTATFSYGIISDDDRANINIEGETTIVTATGGTAVERSYGISSDQFLTITGATVTATGGTARDISYGISIDSTLTISGGTVTAIGGTVTATTEKGSYGIRASNPTIGGDATVTATGGTSNSDSAGITTSSTVTVTGGSTKVTATGGTAVANSYGISTIDSGGAPHAITISGGTVTATGGTAGTNSFGISASDFSVTVTISSSTVTATGGTGGTSSSGISASSTSYTATVTISGSAVTATGGTGDNSYGISASSTSRTATVTIKDSAKVTATGGTGDNSYGVFAFTEVAINGTSKVIATGGTGDNSRGIFAFTKVAITGGTVTATGGTSSGGSYGISEMQVTISGTANVTATGGTASGTTSSEGSFGIFAVNASIEGGTVTATGGTAQHSYGVNAVTALSGGTGTAQTTETTATTTKRAFNNLPTLTGVSLTPAWVDDTPKASASWASANYQITSAPATNGSFTVTVGGTAVTEAAVGDTVTITPTPAGGYAVDAVTVKKTADLTTTETLTNNTFTMPAYGVTVTVTFKAAGGGTTGGTGTSPDVGAPVIIDGKTENIGTEKKSGDTTTVTVDQGKLTENLGKAKTGSSVIVPVSTNNTATATLVVKNVEDMAAKDMILTVRTGSVAYNLSTAAIDTKALQAAFPGVSTTQVPFEVSIKGSAAKVEGETLVISPVEFTVTATHNGKTQHIDTFSAFVDRVIEVTAEQAAKITTAVVVNADGTTRHVPTNVIKKDGKYYAIIYSRTNSTYALIFNDQSFADAAGKWYEAAVNEMGSRKIINGKSATAFDGDASITRAEFAAIIVRALGLPAVGTSTFADVPANAWYSGAVATAVQYKITDGRGQNRFAPNAAITREEAMLMLQRAAALTAFQGASAAIDAFPDAGAVSAWAQSAAKWSVGSGLIQGANGKLNPTENITRAESATIILRLLQKAQLVDVRSKA